MIQVPSITSNRVIQVQVVPPTNAVWVKLSQDPSFRETTNGVSIRITALESNLDYAVVDITYANGTSGGRGAPAGLSDGQRKLRVLGVLAQLSDGGEVPAYATPDWLDRLLFSDTEGMDARGVHNNVKAYWEQNSHGRVQVGGSVYPNWVTLKASAHYVNLPSVFDTPTELTLDAIAAIQQEDPAFFTNEPYDFIVLLFPGDLGAVYNSYYEQSSFWNDPNGLFRGYLLMDLPVDWSSKYFGSVRGETNTALDRLHVQTRLPKVHVAGVFLASDTSRTFNYITNRSRSHGDAPIVLDRPLPASDRLVIVDYSTDYYTETNAAVDAQHVDTTYSIANVRGIWLASDTERAGTNYFTDGSYAYRDNHIVLGQPLPDGSNAVIVEYETGVYFRTWDPEAPFFSTDHVGAWYGTFLHEMAHGLGSHVTFTDTDYIGDLYQGADEIFHYGLMSGGNHLWTQTVPRWQSPTHLDGYTKFALGFLLPYELRHGGNETNLTIYAAEEFPYTSRTKLVKVPLHAAGAPAHRRTDGRDYFGEEYLLLELRKRGGIAGIYNFDSALPHEGLVIYHVIERNPRIVGAFWQNAVKIIDATPATPADWFWNPASGMRALAQSSFFDTAVPFGRDSGMMEYIHGDSWQEIGNSNLLFRLEGSGQQTVYAKFRDFGTNESEVVSANVLLLPGGPDGNTNGIADHWEQHYAGTTNTVTGFANDDPDEDGMSNLDEFLSGTDPMNAASRLELSIRLDPGVVLEFPTVPGRSYVIETARDLARPRWYPLLGGFPQPGTGEAIRYYDTYQDIDTRSYRVRLTTD